ncbi:hypothetical protein D3C78_660850 [compost metagenome]
MRQACDVDREVRDQGVLLVGQLHKPFDQIERFEIHGKVRDVGATFNMQHITQHNGRRTRRHLQRLQADNGCGCSKCAVGVQYVDGGLDQLADVDRTTKYLVVAGSAQAKVNLQPIQVAEQADVGIDQTVPARRIDTEIASQQPPEKQTGNGGLAGIEGQRRTADRQ